MENLSQSAETIMPFSDAHLQIVKHTSSIINSLQEVYRFWKAKSGFSMWSTFNTHCVWGHINNEGWRLASVTIQPFFLWSINIQLQNERSEWKEDKGLTHLRITLRAVSFNPAPLLQVTVRITAASHRLLQTLQQHVQKKARLCFSYLIFFIRILRLTPSASSGIRANISDVTQQKRGWSTEILGAPLRLFEVCFAKCWWVFCFVCVGGGD